MKIEKLNKQELIDKIVDYENLLNNKQRLKRYSKFTIGAFINHLAKLKIELLKRG
jgi:hypothetical protein